MRQIGVLMSFAANDPEGLSRAAAFENGLRKLGWIRGHNLRIEYRWAENPEVLRTDAIGLVGMAPDLILANSTPVMAALQEQRHAVPIVFTHPGGHLTGFTSFEFSIGTKWLETLKQVATRVTRVALVFNPQTAPFADLFWRPIEAAAPSFAKITSLAARHRLPAVYPYRFFTELGGLLSYGVDVTDNFRRAATYADRILKGEKPSDLPVQAPVKFELVINQFAAF
jgi:putative ABC transport system substrate-binding protein